MWQIIVTSTRLVRYVMQFAHSNAVISKDKSTCQTNASQNAHFNAIISNDKSDTGKGIGKWYLKPPLYLFSPPHSNFEPPFSLPFQKFITTVHPIAFQRQGVTTVRFGTELRYDTVRLWQKVRYGITYGIFKKSTVRKYGIIFSVPDRTLSVLQ